MSDDPKACHRAMETALTVFKDPGLQMHHPMPGQPKEIVQMRHLARYEEPGEDNGTLSSATTTSTAVPRAPDHGEPPAAGYFARDFSFRAEFGAQPDWCPRQEAETEPELETDTSSELQLLTPDSDLYDGLYGASQYQRKERERSQGYGNVYDNGNGHGASQGYASYYGNVYGASQHADKYRRPALSEPPSSYGLRDAYVALEPEPEPAAAAPHQEQRQENPFTQQPQYIYEKYRPSYTDGRYECSFYVRRSAAPPAASSTSNSQQQHEQHEQHEQHAGRRHRTANHQRSESQVLRHVEEQRQMSPFEWRLFNASRIQEDE